MSALIAYSVERTRQLLEVLLVELRRADPSHPYAFAYVQLRSGRYRFKRNADAAISLAAAAMTLMFFLAAGAT